MKTNQKPKMRVLYITPAEKIEAVRRLCSPEPTGRVLLTVPETEWHAPRFNVPVQVAEPAKMQRAATDVVMNPESVLESLLQYRSQCTGRFTLQDACAATGRSETSLRSNLRALMKRGWVACQTELLPGTSNKGLVYRWTPAGLRRGMTTEGGRT
jgi:hypothetical protein